MSQHHKLFLSLLLDKWHFIISTNSGEELTSIPTCFHSELRHYVIEPKLCFSAYKTPGLTPGRGQNIYNCDFNSPPPPGQVCDVDIKAFSPCTQENHYSFHKSSPCIFLKLNKIFDWIPAYYNDTTQLPGNMPKELKEYIGKQQHQSVNYSTDNYTFYINNIVYIKF